MAKYNENIPEERIAAREEKLTNINDDIINHIRSLTSFPRFLRTQMQKDVFDMKSAEDVEAFIEKYELAYPDLKGGYDLDWDKKQDLNTALQDKATLLAQINEAKALLPIHAKEEPVRCASLYQTGFSAVFERGSVSIRTRSATTSAAHRMATHQESLIPLLPRALAGLSNIAEERVAPVAGENLVFLLPNEPTIRTGLVSLKLRGFITYERPEHEADPIRVEVRNVAKVIDAFNSGKDCRIGI